MRSIIWGVMVVGLASCSMAPRLKSPDSETRLPAAYDASAADSLRAQSVWWNTFDDPALNRLVDSALVRNLDVRTAVSRVREVQERYRVARSPLLPALQLTVDGAQSSIPSNTGSFGSIGGTIPGFPDRFENVTYSASIGFSYEIDFWGRLRNAAGAALNTLRASRADAETARIGVIAETVNTYYEIAELESRRVASVAIVDLLEERVALSESRYNSGLISSFELYSVRQNYDNERAALPTLDATAYDARGRLAVLLGAYVGELAPWLEATAPALPEPAPIPAGLPADLLGQRPDIIAAAERLEAARRQIGVARAAMMPALALTGAGGTQSSDLQHLVDVGPQKFWNLAASVSAPVFSGGRLRAETRAAWAVYEQSLAAYEKTVLTAFKEVNSTLVAYEREQERYRSLQEAMASATASAQTQRERYERGIGDYLAYLDARTNALRLEANLSATRRALVQARLNVHRALGGGWVEP